MTDTKVDLIFVALHAPLCAVDTDDTSTVHALTMDGAIAGWPDGPFVAPCGVNVRVMTVRNGDDRRLVSAWPPRVKAIAPTRRCLACHKATGSKRPAW